MIRKHHVRFGGGPGEKGCQQYLACGLPYMENIGTLHSQLHDLVGNAAIAMIAEQFEPEHAADTTR